ncbi:hypothetical protein MF627_000075 [Paenibacillus polymyxa]|nr:hypothetical protein [Paenibacillus polymyxa]URJ40589.3 hypothetical protein MF627_000075 [Paenibacillus polymyxa]URJ48558.3 hypothetical protein MF626_002801 [Paenibacillus polymyxa]
MSLSDHPNEEALKLRMAKKASPTGKTFLVSNLLYIALAWIKKRCCFTSQYPSRWISKYSHTAVLYISLAESLQSAIQWLLNSKQVQNTSYLRWRK